MRRWFLSYHSPDEALAERLKTAIQQKDEGAPVFFAPANLRAGGRWVPALAEAIAEATAFVLLVTDKGIGRWQEIEYDAAFDRHVNTPDFPVVLMLLEGQAAPRLSFLKQLHWIVTPDPASEKDVARLIDAVKFGSDAKPGQRWRYASPYRGLSAMEEKDSDYFFGREHETIQVLGVLAAEPGRFPVLLGNSGVGKSSLAQAGVIAALRRQAWPERMTSVGAWPAAFKDSRGWCFLTLRPGAEPIKALVETFLRTWQYDATDSEWEERQKGWVDRLSDGRATLCGLLDATERRYEQIGQPKPRTFFLYVDQGEELYVRGERQRRRFSELLAQAIADPRLVALMSMRSDFLGHLQNDEPLFAVHRKIDVPPLREAELSRVIREPAQQLSARFESEELVAVITRRTLEDSAKDVGALPLLSYTLDDMWTEMVRRDDGVLRLPPEAFELGGVLAGRANNFLARNPNSEGTLRRILTIRIATVRKEGDPTRRRARRSEFSDDEWRLVTELADHPNRLLVTATPEGGETYAEVAHEAIFRRWEKLLDWIKLEREFLAWKTTLDDDRRRWEEAPEASKNDALLLGLALAQAQSWLVQRAEDLSRADREFIDLSQKSEADRREAGRQLEIQRVKAEEEVARLSAEKEAQEHRERAAREEVARLRAEKEAQEQKERAAGEEVARLRAEQEARDQRHRASEEELARLRAENEAREQRERADSILKREQQKAEEARARSERNRRWALRAAGVVFLLSFIPLSSFIFDQYQKRYVIPAREEAWNAILKSPTASASEKAAAIRGLATSNLSLDLTNTTLDGVAVSCIEAQGAKFIGAHLNNVRFERSSHPNAAFSQSAIVGSKFDKTSLELSRFDGAMIADTTFSNANLYRSIFDRALFCQDVQFSTSDVRSASFRSVTFDGGHVPQFNGTAWWLAVGWSMQQIQGLAARSSGVNYKDTPAFKGEMQYYEKWLSTAPEPTRTRASALNGKAWALATYGIDLADAERLSQESLVILRRLAEKPDESGSVVREEANALDTLAYIQMQAGKMGEALENLKAAVQKVRGDEATFNAVIFRYALAQFAVGHRDEAIRNLVLAVDIGKYVPSHELYLLRQHIKGEFLTTLESLMSKNLPISAPPPASCPANSPG